MMEQFIINRDMIKYFCPTYKLCDSCRLQIKLRLRESNSIIQDFVDYDDVGVSFSISVPPFPNCKIGRHL